MSTANSSSALEKAVGEKRSSHLARDCYWVVACFHEGSMDSTGTGEVGVKEDDSTDMSFEFVTSTFTPQIWNK